MTGRVACLRAPLSTWEAWPGEPGSREAWRTKTAEAWILEAGSRAAAPTGTARRVAAARAAPTTAGDLTP